jgi:hypothetical protein
VSEPVIITISGGFTDAVDRDHGTVGDASVYRERDETALAFLDRLVAPRSGWVAPVRCDRRLYRMIPPVEGVAGRLSDRLLDLAGQVKRLAPPDHRDPERFHMAKSELAVAIAALAKDAESRLG